MNHIQDHPLRYELVNELHTRPFLSMVAPGTVAFLALKQESGQARDRDANWGFADPVRSLWCTTSSTG